MKEHSVNCSASGKGRLAAGLVLAALAFLPAAAKAGGEPAFDYLRVLSGGNTIIPAVAPPATARTRGNRNSVLEELDNLPWRENGAVTGNTASGKISMKATRSAPRSGPAGKLRRRRGVLAL
ncbi:MAG TPA: hypothetical protein DCS63_05545 [Elusimicrobia bacterium]|nr:hypothetical protein [Elusimicrobiota bacterium]